MVVYFAVKHAESGQVMQLQVYESMPHVFLLFEEHPCSITCFKEISRFIHAATGGEIMETRLQFVNGKGVVQERPLPVESFPTTYTKMEVVRF